MRTTKPVDALTALLERVSTGNSSAFKPIADDPEYGASTYEYND